MRCSQGNLLDNPVRPVFLQSSALSTEQPNVQIRETYFNSNKQKQKSINAHSQRLDCQAGCIVLLEHVYL